MLKIIPASWQESMRVDFNHRLNFYINPRARVLPALTSAGVSYIENDLTTNMRGTYRMQCGGSTDLTYVYNLPERFIIEGWFKPEFAYNVAGNQTIFAAEDAAEFSIIYNATSDAFDVIQSPGTTLSSPAYTTDAGLQKWHYIRVWYDNTGKHAGMFLLVDGLNTVESENTPGSGDFIPLNKISFFPTVAAETSYWVIHELDSELSTGQFVTYQADRQIFFDFNGLTLGRERIRINAPAGTNRVKSFSLRKSVENIDTGSAGANTANLQLYNINGEFSDDQYDTWNPALAHYNGTQKYLQNRVPIEIESVSPRSRLYDKSGAWALFDFATVPAYPDDPAGTTYGRNRNFTTNDYADTQTANKFSLYEGGWKSGRLSLQSGVLVITVQAGGSILRLGSIVPASKFISILLESPGSSTININGDGTAFSADVVAGLNYIGCYLASNNVYSLDIENLANGINKLHYIYIGTGSAITPPIDNSGNGHHLTANALIPVVDATAPGGRYVKLSGQPSYMSVRLVGFGDCICISGSVYFPAGSTTEKTIFESSADYSATIGAVQVTYNTGGTASRIGIAVCTDTGAYLAGYVALASAGWKHIIAGYLKTTAGNGAAFIYVGGVLQTLTYTATDATRPSVYNGLAYFGSRAGASSWFDGYFAADLVIYDAMPTANAIAARAAYTLLSKNYTSTEYTEDTTTKHSLVEPLFIGRTTPGAFRRDSPNQYYGEVSVDAEDGISELGETRMSVSHSFDSHDLCDPAAESDSLVHDFVRLVSLKTIKNYAFNSSFENATIGNSWGSTGLTLTRDNTYAQFGTYAAKAVASDTTQFLEQQIIFETTDLIDVGDVFNLSAYIYQTDASSGDLRICEYNNTGTLIGANVSTTVFDANTGAWFRHNVSRTIVSPLCTRLLIQFVSNKATTFYVDGVMLTRGIDPIDYHLLNATDGASGSGSADSAASTTYETVAIKADAVDIEHPYCVIKQGDNVWESLKDIGDASIAYYLGMDEDGTLRFAVHYNEVDPATNGSISNVSSVSTSMDAYTANAITVKGAIIKKGGYPSLIWDGKSSGLFTTDDAGNINHPIADGAFLTINGSTTFEAVYKEDIK